MSTGTLSLLNDRVCCCAGCSSPNGAACLSEDTSLLFFLGGWCACLSEEVPSATKSPQSQLKQKVSFATKTPPSNLNQRRGVPFDSQMPQRTINNRCGGPLLPLKCPLQPLILGGVLNKNAHQGPPTLKNKFNPGKALLIYVRRYNHR